MLYEPTPRVVELKENLLHFMDEHVYPAEALYHEHAKTGDKHEPPPVLEELKQTARKLGLWNLFLPESDLGAGLTNLEYAHLCEVMGRSPHIAPEACNCSAPDTGNMEVFTRYGTDAQKEKWLTQLLDGKIRSAFLMTEPDVASSDATNVQLSIRRDGDEYVINGTKWWASGAGDRRTKIWIVMGKTDPEEHKYNQQSMILVEPDTPGVTVERYLPVMGYDHLPEAHWQVAFEDARVPAENILLGEGRGFEIAQGRLGPGRIHHCMRLIGMAERALELMIHRTAGRETFGQRIVDHGVVRDWIAESRIEIDQARLLTLNAAHMMDTVGNKAAKTEIASIKVAAPNMALKVIDRAMQAFGGGGLTDISLLPELWAWARILRLADGPDEVHKMQIARLEIGKHIAKK